jgi:hypothetical protein
LDDVTERIEKLRLDDNSSPYQSIEQPGPSHNGPPKWPTKTLEIVHLDEVGKTRTRLFSKQDGVNVDNSNLGDVDDICRKRRKRSMQEEKHNMCKKEDKPN